MKQVVPTQLHLHSALPARVSICPVHESEIEPGQEDMEDPAADRGMALL